MVKQVNHPEYKIEHVPGFDGLVFTESSSQCLALPQSVAFAHERGGVLQSARQAWAFRIDSNGTLNSEDYQSTRTAALGFLRNGRYSIAMSDSPNPDENILLAQAQEGYCAHRTSGRWRVSRKDAVIARMLERSQDEHRVFPALDNTLELSTRQQGGASPYGSHPVTQAILGGDFTESVATYLRGRGFVNGYVWTLSPKNLQKHGVTDDHVEVRRVGVGGYYDLYGLYAYVRCNYGGRARGVRQLSSGNGGC